jgi:hypothetical protein
MLMLDIDDCAPHEVITRLSYSRIRLADLALYSLEGRHGYFGSRRPTIAAIIAIPTRKSWISIIAPIDRVPYARAISGLSKSRCYLETAYFDVR